MAYFHFNDWQMIGSSPEVMVKAEREPTGGGGMIDCWDTSTR